MRPEAAIRRFVGDVAPDGTLPMLLAGEPAAYIQPPASAIKGRLLSFGNNGIVSQQKGSRPHGGLRLADDARVEFLRDAIKEQWRMPQHALRHRNPLENCNVHL